MRPIAVSGKLKRSIEVLETRWRKTWNEINIIIEGMEKRAKIPSTVLVEGSWLAVVGTTRSEVQFFTMFTKKYKSKVKVLKTISHIKHTSKSPIRLWLSSFQCPCKVIQLSHFYHLTLFVPYLNLKMYIYKTCAHNYSYLWLPRLFAFWYFFMLLALSGQQIISV